MERMVRRRRRRRARRRLVTDRSYAFTVMGGMIP
jgi:hypothetical protein